MYCIYSYILFFSKDCNNANGWVSDSSRPTEPNTSADDMILRKTLMMINVLVLEFSQTLTANPNERLIHSIAFY